MDGRADRGYRGFGLDFSASVQGLSPTLAQGSGLDPGRNCNTYAGVMQAALAFFRHAVRAARTAATDTRIPKPLRWLAALGLLPIPGPFDEALLLLVAVPLALFYRRPIAEAWASSGDVDRAG